MDSTYIGKAIAIYYNPKAYEITAYLFVWATQSESHFWSFLLESSEPSSSNNSRLSTYLDFILSIGKTNLSKQDGHKRPS